MLNLEKGGHMFTDPDDLEYLYSHKPKSNYTLNMGKVRYYEYDPHEIIQQIETKITRKIYLASSLTKRKFQTISHNVKLSRHDINPQNSQYQNNQGNQESVVKNSLLCLAKIYGNDDASLLSQKKEKIKLPKKIMTERSSYSQRPGVVHFSGKKKILNDYLQGISQDPFPNNIPPFKDKRSLSYSKKTKYTKTLNYTEQNEEEGTLETNDDEANYISNPYSQFRSVPRKKESDLHTKLIKKITAAQNGKENEVHNVETQPTETENTRGTYSRKQQFIRNQVPIIAHKEKLSNYPLFEKKVSTDNFSKFTEKKPGSQKTSFAIFKPNEFNIKKPMSRDQPTSIPIKRFKSLKREDANAPMVPMHQLKHMMPNSDRPPSRHKSPEKHSGLDLLSVIQSDDTDNRNILQDLDDDLEQRLENTTSGNDEFEDNLDRLLEISDLDNPSELSGRRKFSPNKDMVHGMNGIHKRQQTKANSGKPIATEKEEEQHAYNSALIITKKQHSNSSNKLEMIQTIESLKFKSKKKLAFGVPLDSKSQSKSGTEQSSRKNTTDETPNPKYNKKVTSRSHRVLPFNTSLDKQFVGLFGQ